MNIKTRFNIGDIVHFKEYRTMHGDFAEGEIRRITIYRTADYGTSIRYNIPYLSGEDGWCETDRWEDDLTEEETQYKESITQNENASDNC